jgi:hypothetical protein
MDAVPTFTQTNFQLKYRSQLRNSPDLKAKFSMPHWALALKGKRVKR